MEWITLLLWKTSILFGVKVFVASAVSWCWHGQGNLSVHNLLLFPVIKDQKVKARGVISDPCKDVARTIKRATSL